MDFFVQLIGVLGVFAVMAALLWLLRRRGIAHFAPLTRAARKGRIGAEVVDRLVLTPQHSVHILRVGDHVLLIGVSPAGCTRLGNFAWAEITAAGSRGEVQP
jgi:flagellar biogenesis protein FliO